VIFVGLIHAVQVNPPDGPEYDPVSTPSFAFAVITSDA
jgi:hypothetical protein